MSSAQQVAGKGLAPTSRQRHCAGLRLACVVRCLDTLSHFRANNQRTAAPEIAERGEQVAPQHEAPHEPATTERRTPHVVTVHIMLATSFRGSSARPLFQVPSSILVLFLNKPIMCCVLGRPLHRSTPWPACCRRRSGATLNLLPGPQSVSRDARPRRKSC